jgi:hypothetical protein
MKIGDRVCLRSDPDHPGFISSKAYDGQWFITFDDSNMPSCFVYEQAIMLYTGVQALAREPDEETRERVVKILSSFKIISLPGGNTVVQISSDDFTWMLRTIQDRC